MHFAKTALSNRARVLKSDFEGIATAGWTTTVEGHQCHRVAYAHRRLLLGRAFEATSPNGRFVEGAAAISGKPLARIEVHGKYLFYFFAARPQEVPTVLHYHFGMSGAFRTMQLPGAPPTQTTRLCLINRELGLAAHLSAMTVLHGGPELYEQKIAKLGPDPLREDADKERLWQRINTPKCRKPIGLVLMDQSYIAGLGNIYRAEVLFKSGVHPEQPACSITRPVFERLWHHSTVLLQRGFSTGSILTVDPEDAKAMGRPWTRRYVYNHSQCGRCKGVVRTWDMAARTVHACETCQPLLEAEAIAASTAAGATAAVEAVAGGLLTAERAAALRAAAPARVFRSHCAAEDPGDMMPGKMTVVELRAALQQRSLPCSGTKAVLAGRLAAALEQEAAQQEQQNAEKHREQLVKANNKSKSRQHQHVAAAGIAGASSGVAAKQLGGRKRQQKEAQEAVAPAPLLFSDDQAEGDGEEGGEASGSEDELDKLDGMLTKQLAVPAAAANHTGAAVDEGAASGVRPTPDWSKMAAAQVKQELRARGLPVTGRKAHLIERLAAASAAGAASPTPMQVGAAASTARGKKTVAPTATTAATVAAVAGHEAVGANGGSSRGSACKGRKDAAGWTTPTTPAAMPGKGLSNDTPGAPLAETVVGISHIEYVANARDAAIEKILAGESRGVEHVAMRLDDATAAVKGPDETDRGGPAGTQVAAAIGQKRRGRRGMAAAPAAALPKVEGEVLLRKRGRLSISEGKK